MLIIKGHIPRTIHTVVFVFDGTISVVDTAGTELGSLTVGEAIQVGGVNYTLWRYFDQMCVVIAEPDTITTRRSDIDGNGISDVMFAWSG
ncbi:MAG: hypothetical protein IKY02_05035, partial [Lachnospiraceae bacterium]|nr:hypothetical protein [Lachnospiraceae bacterium]